MAFAPVQTSAQTQTTSTSANITVSATGINNLVLVHIRLASATETVTSITDDVGNTYVVGTGVVQGTSTIYQGYGVQTTGGTTTITVNVSGSVNITCGADEFSGGATTNAAVLDVTATNTGTGTSLSVSLTASAVGKLVVATGRTTGLGSWSAGFSYTLYFNSGTPTRALASEYRLVSVIGETAPMTFSGSGDWAEIARSYNPAPSTNLGSMFAVF